MHQKKRFEKGWRKYHLFFMKKMLDKKFYIWYNIGVRVAAARKKFFKKFLKKCLTSYLLYGKMVGRPRVMRPKIPLYHTLGKKSSKFCTKNKKIFILKLCKMYNRTYVLLKMTKNIAKNLKFLCKLYNRTYILCKINKF